MKSFLQVSTVTSPGSRKPVFYTDTSSVRILHTFCVGGCLVRLVGSNKTYEGRLEVFYNGVWGTVCDDYFDQTEARVFCYQLGFG